MKRIAGVVLTIMLLAGTAFTAQIWIDRPQSGATEHSTVQIANFPFSEPVSIVLSSIVLLGSTTMLRRRRTHRSEVLEVKEPRWRFLPAGGTNAKEVI